MLLHSETETHGEKHATQTHSHLHTERNACPVAQHQALRGQRREGTAILLLADASGVCSPSITQQHMPEERHAGICDGTRVPACMHTRVWGCQLHLLLTHLFIPTKRWGRNCCRVGRQSLPAFSSLTGLPSGNWGGRSPRPILAEGEYVGVCERKSGWVCL